MRSIALLLALALLLSFLAGFLQLSLPPVPAADRDELDALFVRFSRQTPCACEVSLASFARDGGAALLDPAAMLPATATLPLDELRLFAAAVALDRASARPLADPMLRKAAVWHQWVRHPERPLPPDFFDRAPQIHPAGGSYVRLARLSGLAAFRGGKWLLEHLPHAHALELAELRAAQPGFVLDAPRAAVASLSAGGLEALHDRDPVVLDEGYLLLALPADSTPERAASVAWSAYPRSAWDRFLSATPYRLAPHTARALAVARRGRLDWQVDLPRVRSRAARLQALTFGGLAMLAIGVAALLFMRISARDEEARRRRFMLQTLAHELRTPLTSMSLALESLRDRFEELPPAAQDALGRLFDDAARLARVVETSRHYLRDGVSGSVLELTPQKIPGVNEWIAELVTPPAASDGPGAELTGLSSDCAATLDGHWVGVCVRNLIENALRHGLPPVRVTLTREGDALFVTVADAGSCAFHDLDAMALPFVRGPQSSGTGLGLAIVQSIAHELGGTLTYQPAPTRFCLRLPGVLA